MGVDLGEIEVIVHARPIVGKRYVFGGQGKMSLEKEWNQLAAAYAYQVVLKDIAVHEKNVVEFTSISDVFKPKTTCFMLGHPHYGAMGEVVSVIC